MPSKQLIVLKKIKLKGDDTLLNCYTNHSGKSSLIIRKGGKSKNYAAASYLHPLSILEYETENKKVGELSIVKEFTPIFNLQSIRENIYKNAIAIFISELIYKTIREIEPNPQLYRFLINNIIALENNHSDFGNNHTKFIVDLCSHLGYEPENNYSQTARHIFDIQRACFTDIPESADYSFGQRNSHILSSLLIDSDSQTPYNQIIKNGKERYLFINDMVKYLSFHTGYKIEIESLSVLHEVFE